MELIFAILQDAAGLGLIGLMLVALFGGVLASIAWAWWEERRMIARVQRRIVERAKRGELDPRT